jgi:3'-phosphoadenosine 5'-phosphosulfate sulfotransferase (PAPS reductase)/FAD synthetase
VPKAIERPWQETERILREAAEKSDAVLVAFSGGKESLTVLDLCSRTFKRVEAFFMAFLPGLRCCEPMMEYAEERWGVKVRQYLHPQTVKNLVNEIYCPPREQYRDLEKLSIQDIHEIAAQESGVRLIATGQRRADYMFRAANARNAQRTETICPVVGWNKFDVMAYLKQRKIPIPDAQSGAQTTGIDLSTPRILWLHDHYPDDFARIEKLFPYVGVVPARRQFYGVT